MLNNDFSQEIEDSEQELFEHYKIEAGKKQELLRVDKFLMNHIENATRTKLQMLPKLEIY